MKIINTQKELEELIDSNNNIIINEALDIRCDICIDANINARNIDAGNINAGTINAWNIDARNIDAGNINAWNIKAGDINAWNIDAGNINAGNINAWNIKAGNISYYAVCYAYESITCKSIIGRRENSKHFVLDGTITIK